MQRRMYLSAAAVLAVSAGSANALEGGTSAYLLGSRDTFAGAVGKPGSTIVTNNFFYWHGDAPTLSLGGVAVANPEVDIYLYRLDIAHFFDVEIFGGTPGFVLSVPAGSGAVDASGAVGRFSGAVEDENIGFSDPILTSVIGWHAGNFHYSAGVSFFLPWGKYNSATVDLGPPPEIDDFLNFGKNRLTIMPVVSATYLDPSDGLEFSGAMSLEFPFENSATDWRTAPILNLEGAVLQHLPSGFAFGVAGYMSQQIGEDSGAGADSFKATVGADSLKARVFGIGPILTYSTKFDETPVNFKMKYTHEFAAKRRFESDVVSLSVNFSF
ncbi:transporter [Ensifer sp. LC163]|uniref:SphA family protein n=1 Tax=Ensifer sp. LC163 TaxID=1120652 RepID=UPI0009F441B6|nr:transporter [Ensifer sp. LC163]